VNSSSNVVNKIITSPTDYGKKNPGRRPKKISRRDLSALLRIISSNRRFYRKALASTSLPVSVRTVQRLEESSLGWIATKYKPKLEPRHIEARKVFAIMYFFQFVNMATAWNELIFSDEKKFHLDGFKCYRYNLRKEPQNCLQSSIRWRFRDDSLGCVFHSWRNHSGPKKKQTWTR